MIALLVGFSVYYGGVSNAPLLLVFVLSSVVGVVSCRDIPFTERIHIFSSGAGSKNLLMMVWIFMLAGAFAAGANQMGAAEAMVNLTLAILPARFALVGLFLAACVTSLCMGTSVGTIVALMPIAAGMADKTGIGMSMIAAAVVGGAFFGDNLSFISDTTIVATQSQGCRLNDKFRYNAMIVLPVALVVSVLYVIIGSRVGNGMETEAIPRAVGLNATGAFKVFPYLMVLVCAAVGMHVLVVLGLGNLLTCIVGLADRSFNLMGWIDSTLKGVMGMSELILISMLAGGIFALISYNGGLDYVIGQITRRVQKRAGAEVSICALVAFANICTANNTIAILSVGDIAQRIAKRFGIDPRRSASLLDTTSCCVQGMLPYGAQLLMASGLAGISALSIMPYLFYPAFLAAAVLITICIHHRRA